MLDFLLLYYTYCVSKGMQTNTFIIPIYILEREYNYKYNLNKKNIF